MIETEITRIFFVYLHLQTIISCDMFRLEATWMGQVFYDFSRGIDNWPVISEWERKSVSCEQTFESDINENAAVTIHLYHTVLELVRRIEKTYIKPHVIEL